MKFSNCDTFRVKFATKASCCDNLSMAILFILLPFLLPSLIVHLNSAKRLKEESRAAQKRAEFIVSQFMLAEPQKVISSS